MKMNVFVLVVLMCLNASNSANNLTLKIFDYACNLVAMCICYGLLKTSALAMFPLPWRCGGLNDTSV